MRFFLMPFFTMRKIILYLPIAFLLFSCIKKRESTKSTAIVIKNIAIDSVGVRLIHYMDGKELVDTLIAVKDTLVLDQLKDDMYLVAISWPRTLIPHQIYRDKSFNKDIDEYYVLSKAFYVDPLVSSKYEFYMDSIYTGEEIELNSIAKVNVNTSSCETCAIAEKYWNNYNIFFDRKDMLVDALNLAYYKSVDGNNDASRNRFLKVDSVKKTVFTDSLYKRDFDQLVHLYPESKASTFFVFYQLYVERNFEKYKNSVNLLQGKAKESRYYKMIQNQYKN